MTLFDFESYVPSKILARGEAYYITDAIKDIEETATDAWKATVIGSEAYTVSISLKGEEIASWHCSCPYDGDLCKHVVATLLTIRNQKKKHFIPQVEDVPVVVDEAIVNQVIKYKKESGEIAKLISFIDLKALAAFVCEYAATHADLREALQQRFIPAKNEANPSTDYSEDIQECFTSSCRKSSSYSRYSDYEESDFDDYEESDSDIYAISSQLDIYLDKATFLLEQKSFGDVASIVLQIFRSIGELCDEDDDSVVYDEAYLFTDTCETAAALLLQLAENAEVPQPLKDHVLDELCDIATLEGYCDYCIYEMDALVDDFNRTSQTKEEAVKRIDKMLLEAKEDSDRVGCLVEQKIDFLRELSRPEEAEKVTEKYLYLPSIREIKIRRLLDDKKYEEALQTIDEGIEKAKKLNDQGTLFSLKKAKLNIYQQTCNIPQIIVVAKDMFISDGGKMESYRLLKRYISAEEWRPFLKSLMGQADLESHSFFGSSVEADIYVEEKDEEQLMKFLTGTLPHRQIDALQNYAPHLKEGYSAEILALYAQRIQEYAEKNVGRNHYEHVVSVLRTMKKFNEGTKVVNELVQLFQLKYKKRPAMMEVLSKL